MTPIIPYRKEKPLTSLASLGGGAAGMANAGLAEKVYAEDVFSTYLYKGTNGSKVATTGVDMTKGGLVWWKNRAQSSTQHIWIDTVRGQNKVITSDSSGAEFTGNYSQTFTTTGWTMNNGFGDLNNGNTNYTSWNFRKQEGFFDVVTWTGNGTAGRQISHNLGCAPGMVAIKCTSDGHNWTVWHRGLSSNAKTITLNDSAGELTSDDFNGAAPSSTVIHLSSTANSNGNGKTYVAYLWAGGESTADTARSVYVDGSGDWLSTGSSSDFTMGTGDFTIECWARFDDYTNRGVFQISDSSNGLSSAGGGGAGGSIAFAHNGSNWHIYGAGSSYNTPHARTAGSWYHIAYTRSSGVSRCFVNGTKTHEFTDTYNYNGTHVAIGGYYNTSYLMKGEISNFRIIKGTALYTSSFKVPTEPLTNITNTKLLCCNNSSVIGSTINSSGSLTAHGNTNARTDSPFDDSDGFKFGEEADQNLIKTNSYIGNGSSDGPEIFLGFEPQWILYKCTNANESWTIYDSMRGWATWDNERGLYPNTTIAEEDQAFMDITPTGFRITTADQRTNGSSKEYIYIAIRRPDPLVGKPAEAGTDVFTMDAGSSGSGDPGFDSGFPVDFAFIKQPSSGGLWNLSARLMQSRYLRTNESNAGADDNSALFDYNDGYYVSGGISDWQAWMWKRDAGFDVVTYKGTQIVGQAIAHNLSKTPEMMWVKRRSGSSDGWAVYHKGLNGGSSPEDWNLKLEDQSAQEDTNSRWNDTAPTSTHFFLGDSGRVNNNNDQYIAMLFASVDGISKCGYYTGTGVSGNAVTLGFAPRFVIIKNTSRASTSWLVLDTLRGWTSGTDKGLELNDTNAQSTYDYANPTSTGFTLSETGSWTNLPNDNYIYYAHA
mgnify:CR=1 FL=1|tara:strand:+ start:52 stop:2691 length:2640 start_codon:yes stop_codon:yes gene_type:complete